VAGQVLDFKKTQHTFSEHGRWVSVVERVLRLPPATEISLSARFSIRLRKCNLVVPRGCANRGGDNLEVDKARDTIAPDIAYRQIAIVNDG
jgi:hypothetical protein